MVTSGPKIPSQMRHGKRKSQANFEENNAVYFSYCALDYDELLFGKSVNFVLNFFFFILLPCNVINVFQIPTYCTIYLLDKTHVKIRTSNPLTFFKI